MSSTKVQQPQLKVPKSIDLSLTINDLPATSYPGGAGSDLITVDGESPTIATTDVVKAAPGNSITWTFSRGDHGDTYLCALVFGIHGPAGRHWRGGKPGLFDIPATSSASIHESQFGWASPLHSTPGTAFTYLLSPTTTSWTLDVNWGAVNTSGLITTYPPPRNPTDPTEKPALVLKYRLYCYSTVQGLWYVDPELDLCPQG